MDSFSRHLKKEETDGSEIWGQKSLTLQQGCCRGYSLGYSIHTVDGLEELRDTIILIRYQHLNLIRASMVGGEKRGAERRGKAQNERIQT